MPITQIKYGKHQPVLLLEFGTGDITFTKGYHKNGTVELIFTQTEPHRIGREHADYEGKTVDEIPNIHAVFAFTKPESITALIHSLIVLQKELFDPQVFAQQKS